VKLSCLGFEAGQALWDSAGLSQVVPSAGRVVLGNLLLYLLDRSSGPGVGSLVVLSRPILGVAMVTIRTQRISVRPVLNQDNVARDHAMNQAMRSSGRDYLPSLFGSSSHQPRWSHRGCLGEAKRPERAGNAPFAGAARPGRWAIAGSRAIS
jgi:hypothetical protein